MLASATVQHCTPTHAAMLLLGRASGVLSSVTRRHGVVVWAVWVQDYVSVLPCIGGGPVSMFGVFDGTVGDHASQFLSGHLLPNIASNPVCSQFMTPSRGNRAHRSGNDPARGRCNPARAPPLQVGFDGH